MNFRLLVFGPENLTPDDQTWVTNQVTTLIEKFKTEQKFIFVYSPLNQGCDLECTLEIQKMGMPVIGCIPFEYYSEKFSPKDKTKLRQVRRNLYFTKIIDRKPSYECYRKRELFLAQQTNVCIAILNKDYSDDLMKFFKLLKMQWYGKNKTVYHIDHLTKTSTTFNL